MVHTRVNMYQPSRLGRESPAWVSRRRRWAAQLSDHVFFSVAASSQKYLIIYTPARAESIVVVVVVN
jgi:hypothetical protein